MSPAPWYKAKLSSKCFQEYSCKKERYSDALNSQRWRFLKSGLDDFRNGCCPPSDNIIIRGKKGPVPVILHYKKPDPSQIASCKPWELRTKSDISFSKLSPSQKAQKEYIAQTERCLTEHPLALYPHLEESVPPELFCDVVKLLDPEMHQSRISQGHPKPKEILPTLQYQVQSDGLKPEVKYSSATEFWKPKYKNPYMWLSHKEVAAREEASRTGYAPPLDENIKKITKDFCDWVNAMGGEQYNIDEATLMKLFDTRYETKAASSTPIKIVELYQVPAELRMCLGRPPSLSAYKRSDQTQVFLKMRCRGGFDQETSKCQISEALTPTGGTLKFHIQNTSSLDGTEQTLSEPKREKIKYGAWYLHPKLWKKQKANEKPEVPEILQNFLKLRKHGKKEEVIKPLHGIYAFEEFLELKGYRKPADKADSQASSLGSQGKSPETPKKEEKEQDLYSDEVMKKLRDDKMREFKTRDFSEGPTEWKVLRTKKRASCQSVSTNAPSCRSDLLREGNPIPSRLTPHSLFLLQMLPPSNAESTKDADGASLRKYSLRLFPEYRTGSCSFS